MIIHPDISDVNDTTLKKLKKLLTRDLAHDRTPDVVNVTVTKDLFFDPVIRSDLQEKSP